MNATVTVNPLSRPVQHTPIVSRKPVIKIIGLGGGGSNAINRLMELDLQDVEYIVANTDIQALNQNQAPKKIQLGPHLTRGLGAGGNPKVGEAAAEESYRELAAALAGADMVFLTAGMGGGTGTGSISVAARAARAVGAVTVAVVTTPFSFELGRRQQNAREGLARLQPHTDTLITVPNDRLLQIAPRNLTLDLAFHLADDVLRQGIQGIAELITQPGLINVDFAHIRQVIQRGGGAMMSIGIGEGENKALKAVEQALSHPLLDSISIEGATGIIANFTGGSNLSFLEVMDALNHLQKLTCDQADIIPGVISDPRMEDRAQVILVIAGLGATAVDTAPAGAVKESAAMARKTEAAPEMAPARLPIIGPNQTPATSNRAAAGPSPAVAQVPASPAMKLITGTERPSAATGAPSATAAASAGQSPAVGQPIARTQPASTSLEISAANPADLDLPAFMRRRTR